MTLTLEARAVTKTYRHTAALDHLDFEVRGRIVPYRRSVWLGSDLELAATSY